jgi:hypothetical protein
VELELAAREQWVAAAAELKDREKIGHTGSGSGTMKKECELKASLCFVPVLDLDFFSSAFCVLTSAFLVYGGVFLRERNSLFLR